MRVRKSLMKAIAFAGLILTAACNTTVDGGSANDSKPLKMTGSIHSIPSSDLNGLTPLDLKPVIARYFAENPDRNEMSLKVEGTRFDGFAIGRNDRIYFDGFRSSKPNDDQSDIVSKEGNRICAAPSGNWLGGCIDSYKTSEGRIVIVYNLSSGRVMQYLVKGKRV